MIIEKSRVRVPASSKDFLELDSIGSRLEKRFESISLSLRFVIRAKRFPRSQRG